MKALSLKTWFQIVLVIAVFALLGYAFGFHMLFMHNAFEVFYYALYFAGALSLYSLVGWTYQTLFVDAETIPAK